MPLIEEQCAENDQEELPLEYFYDVFDRIKQGKNEAANNILKSVDEGVITPAQARAQLMEMRKRSLLDARAADRVLGVIGNRE